MSAVILPRIGGLAASSPGAWQPRHVFGETSFRTDADVQAVTFGPDGLWSVEEGGGLRRWEAATGRLLNRYDLEEDATVWAFRPDGRLLAGCSADLILWDIPSARRRMIIPQPAWVTSVAFLPDSDLVATGHDDGIVRLWDGADGQLLREFRGYFRSVSALAFSPDGKRIVSAGEDKLMLIWNMASGEIEGLLGGHTDRIPALLWHPDGRRIISAGWDTTARIWDVETREPIILLNSHVGQVVALGLSSDGNLLACADGENAVHIWDLSVYEELHVLRDTGAELRCLAFNADGTKLAAGGADYSLHLWQTNTGQCLSGKVEPPGAAASVSISPNGQRLVGVHGSALRIWNTDSGELTEQRHDPELRTAAYSPDGQLLALAGEGVILQDTATGRSRPLPEGPMPPITVMAFAPAAPLLAGAGDASADVWIWNTRTGEPALLIPDAAPGCTVQCLAFHPRRPALAVGGCDWYETGGSDGTVILWDVTSKRREVLLGGGATAIAFDPTGCRLAVAGLDHVVRVWDLIERRLVGERIGHADTVRGLAYSPAGGRLATASDDRTVRLWDVDAEQPILVASLSVQANSIVFSSDGKALFTANGDGSCSEFSIPTECVSQPNS
jgi:WD40 repeat protein